MDHKSKDTHLGGTTVVELDSGSALINELWEVRGAELLDVVFSGVETELD